MLTDRQAGRQAGIRKLNDSLFEMSQKAPKSANGRGYFFFHKTQNT
jgi:putative heme iron utilization protein